MYLAVCALQGDGAFALTNYRPKCCVAGQKGNQHPLHPPVPLLTGDNQGRGRGRKLSYSSGPRYRVGTLVCVFCRQVIAVCGSAPELVFSALRETCVLPTVNRNRTRRLSGPRFEMPTPGLAFIRAPGTLTAITVLTACGPPGAVLAGPTCRAPHRRCLQPLPRAAAHSRAREKREAHAQTSACRPGRLPAQRRADAFAVHLAPSFSLLRGRVRHPKV